MRKPVGEQYKRKKEGGGGISRWRMLEVE